MDLSFPALGAEGAPGYVAGSQTLTPTPQFLAGVEAEDHKSLSGKTGLAPSCHPHAPPSAVGLASAKAPPGHLSPGFLQKFLPRIPGSPPGHCQVDKGKAWGEADGGSKSGSWYLLAQ